ncbi:MOSC domain-containing protein [Teredinibacter turnerae]|uniref:MOSC domain-containing protein n=1 Tax=Teredinibacter turnerae TaxID=2426 RepID=UPI0003776465|nr:MOSC domain-containing protein [Teredinibacter turnerae]
MKILALSKSAQHSFTKECCESLNFLAGLGVEGDAHCGTTVKHRSRVRVDPTQPNLRQVHLIHSELLDELRAVGFAVAPGTLGENVLTRGIKLLDLPADTVLTLGDTVRVRITGLRNPCAQLDNYQQGLTAAVLDRAEDGTLIRKAGIMAVVETGGCVRVGDSIAVKLPDLPHRKLERV